MQSRKSTVAVTGLMLTFALGCADVPIIGEFVGDLGISDMLGGFGMDANGAADAECASNVNAIKTAQIAYDAGFDAYIDANDWPDATPGTASRAWPNGSGFDTLGWAPDGPVVATYSVYATSSTNFEVTCRHDADGDGLESEWKATKVKNATQTLDNGNPVRQQKKAAKGKGAKAQEDTGW